MPWLLQRAALTCAHMLTYRNGGCLSRSEAVELGCFLMDIGVFFHILNEHRLKDEVLFYRFAVRRDEEGSVQACPHVRVVAGRVEAHRTSRVGGD